MEGNEVLAVDRSTKPLIAVVVGVGHLHVVDGCASAYRAQGETIDFLVFLEGITGKLDAHILQRATVVVGVGATMLGARTTLDLLGQHAIVVGSLTADDQATPVARTTAACSLLRGEHDGLVGGTVGNELATRLHDERGLGVLVALDDGASRDGQRGAIGHIHPTLEQVGAAVKGLVALEHKVLVTIANDVALGGLLAVVGKEHVVAGLESTVFRPHIFLRGRRCRIIIVA